MVEVVNCVPDVALVNHPTKVKFVFAGLEGSVPIAVFCATTFVIGVCPDHPFPSKVIVYSIDAVTGAV